MAKTGTAEAPVSGEPATDINCVNGARAPDSRLGEKESPLLMSRQTTSVESMVRHAFGLLLEIRRHPQASRLLSEANGFLKALIQHADAETSPVVVSVQAVRIRRT